MQSKTAGVVRFAEYALDLRTGELHRNHLQLKLQPQPAKVLVLLVRRAGELLTRQEIAKQVWDSDVFVDYEQGLNFAIRQIRAVLEDDPDHPQFLETIPKRGYRFVAPVEEVTHVEVPLQPKLSVETGLQPGQSVGASLVGKKVSHYRVLEIIGGGGMGLVYKAEDLKLGRRVALKFLPEELARDSISLQRFEREAHTASTLNHRNICTIYEVEEHDGQPCLVMELLEGETLRDRLAAWQTKPIPVDEMLQIAIQICDGLQAAHQSNIIHRDIKPANIFLTTAGQVKILDFGLARFMAGESEAVNADAPDNDLERACATWASTGQPTSVDHTLTQTGSAMGTAGYMSPEQARGEKLDPRTDIFSFGLVLYEMAAGQRAFSGETAAVVHDAILHNSPVPLRELNSTLPAKLVATIDKCLEKDREERCQSAAEVRTALQAVNSGAENKASGRIRAAVAVGVLVLVALAVGLYMRRASHAPRPGSSSSSLQVRPLTAHGKSYRVAATPDGSYIAYVKEGADTYELRLLQVATDRDVQILPAAPQQIHSLHFSRDGNFLYFLRVLDPAKDPHTSGVFRIGTLGGPVTTLATDARTVAERANSVTVSPDGKQIAYIAQTASESLIVAIDPDGSNRRVLAKRPLGLDFWFVEWSPSQDTLAAVANVKDDMVLFRVDLPAGSMRNLSGPGWTIGQPAWSSDGATIFAPAMPTNNGDRIMQIWAFGARTGVRRALTSSSMWYYEYSLSATANDDLVVNTLAAETNLSVTDQSGQPYPIPALRGEGADSAVWVDNRIVTGTSNQMVVHDTDGRNPTKLQTYSSIYRQLARCGPDHVAYWAVDAKRHSHIARTDITTGSSSALTDGPNDTQPTCTADGSTLVCVRCSDNGNHCALTRKSLDSGQSGELYQFDPADDVSEDPSPSVSPDGKSVLFWRYTHAEDTHEWAAIIPIAGGEVKKVRMPVPASQFGAFGAFRWAADGKSILYSRNESGVDNIWSVPLAGGAPKRITNFDSEHIFAFDVSPENRLVISRGNWIHDVVLIKNVREGAGQPAPATAN